MLSPTWKGARSYSNCWCLPSLTNLCKYFFKNTCSLALLLFFSITDAYAIPLFLEQDIEEIISIDSAIHLTEPEQTTIISKELPCLFNFSHLKPMILSAAVRISCALPTKNTEQILLTVMPEISYRNKAADMPVRPSILLGITGKHRLFLKNSKSTFYGNFAYKFIPRSSTKDSYLSSFPGYNTYLLQEWYDILETYYEFGLIFNDKFIRNFDTKISYRESLPLAFRTIGNIKYSSAIDYKMLMLETRTKFSNYFLGGGIGYLYFKADSLLVALPFPIFSFGYYF